MKNGIVVHKLSPVSLTVQPQETITKRFREIPTQFMPESDYHLELSLIQKNVTAMIPKGHEIAWDQFLLKEGAKVHMPSISNDALAVTENSSVFIIQNSKTQLA